MSESIRILLVEDNPGDARLLRETLREAHSLPFHLVHASRLSEALELVVTEPPDVVLLDLSLPDAHGMETVARMLRAAPEVPIIVLSGLADETVAVQAVQSGAQDYLVKGTVEGGTLARAIRYAIERKRLDSAKSQFIARAAHELRTPLTVLAALGETLGERFHQLSPEQLEESLQALSRQGRRARSLISNLLVVSPGQDHYRHVRLGGAHLYQGVHALGVREPQVQ